MEKQRKKKHCSGAETFTAVNSSQYISTLQAFLVHFFCALGLAIALWVTRNFYYINLVSDPYRTLRLLWIVDSIIVVLLYGWFRLNPEQCSYLKAVGRGLLALPIGAVLNAFGAIVLGAPVGIQYLPKTINWSLLMSSFTVVPAACIFGSSWSHWQRLFAFTKPNESIEYMICIPAHGAILGAWFGAWPMPLDWERPWQEWPICVTYGAIIGYVVALVVSLGFVLVQAVPRHLKGE
ncbi:PIGF/3-ketodihydrosphingosine reductase fusion protein [Euphorbia lathyris]|uniref:PIGF/3-ketodihydrosphingosine reductase fusion protein n=1 Tax=Euphorbia lathyris TaxID=212925 RepID=UPI0033138AE1